MNISTNILSLAAIAAMTCALAIPASAQNDEFESLYQAPGVSAVRLNHMMLQDFDLDTYAGLENYTSVQTLRVNGLTLLSAESAVSNVDSLKNVIVRIIDDIRPKPQIIMQVYDDGESVCIYTQPDNEGQTTGPMRCSRMIILTTEEDELNLINIDGTIVIGSD